MCLSRVTKTETPSTVILDGWKSFGDWKTPRFQAFRHNGKAEVPMDVWLTADVSQAEGPNGSFGIQANDRQYYPAGFHIYTDEKNKHVEARRRVYYRRATTTGTQDGRAVVIAQEMYVPSKPDAWPPQ